VKADVLDLALITDLRDEDFDTFRAALQVLVSRTFLLRGVKGEERLYDFTVRNPRLFDAYFACLDATLVRDESLGVVAFRGGGETRLRLSRDETCALLVFRLLYEEKRTELTLAEFPSVTVFDFLQRYRAVADGELRKTRLAELLRRLAAHRLIALIGREPANPDMTILLYPSLALTLDKDGMDEILAALEKEKDLHDNP
jgi:hypothetical protein